VLHIKTELGNRKISEPGQESPDLTNERKIMSTKTLRKRIALVAVSAMGFGLLTSVSANAAAGTGNFDYSAANSVGVCAFGAETNDTTKVGEILSTGTIGLSNAGSEVLAGTVNDYLQLAITGPATWSGMTMVGTAGTDQAVVSYPTASTVRFTVTSAAYVKLPSLLLAKVNGTGAVQIAVSKNVGGTVSDVELYTFTASASCVTGSPSVTNSIVKLAYNDTIDTVAEREALTSNTTDATAATGTVAGGNYEYAASASLIANGGTAHVGVLIRDVTSSKNNVTTQGVFSASATNGAIVAVTSSAADSTGLALEASSATAVGPATGSAQQARVYVKQGTANKDKALDTVVSVYFNGVLYGTRSIKFTGKASKITISAADSLVSKATSTGLAAVVYEITDAAGNLLTSTGTGISGATSGGANNGPLVAASLTVVDPTQAILTSGSVLAETSGAGGVTMTCGTGSGSAKVTVKYTFSDLSSITSDPYDAACAYTAVNYKASLDKSSYAPGEVATLTITATDKNGKPVYDVDSAGDGVALGASAAKAPAISLPQMTAVVTPTYTDTFASGKKTYKFTVGSTEGSFTGVVDLPSYDGTTYSQTAQTVSYKVAAPSTGAVSNAEVLAAIVKLIASINKQIAALQKALTKKK